MRIKYPKQFFCLMEKIQNQRTNSYLIGTEDLIKSCVIAQKFIRTGDFLQGRIRLEQIVTRANYLKKRIEEET